MKTSSNMSVVLNSFFIVFLSVIFSFYSQQAIANIERNNSDTYQCNNAGKITFSQFPCKEGTSTISNIKAPAVSKEDYQKASKRAAREKKELAKIIKEQDKENAQAQKISRATAQKNKKAKDNCAAYKLKAKWAKEDLRNTQPKSEMKAQIKLRRAQEKADLACKK